MHSTLAGRIIRATETDCIIAQDRTSQVRIECGAVQSRSGL